ncbi:hypothetical protein Misp01_07100 [Microtetraspora sp. NBRC 13810]|uniref:hypothetical protein n=1 Tax=Microtetraspora sp. NBRC 13810 TaxID=3030990 RepID=UPI0024A5152C|nr:hypothetical protein [Microtetraspora sp. NBRC 13810]GLW05580.1 hypothetical protein Misp01_07100 [Microtetraspora sp. NBRC 13810]
MFRKLLVAGAVVSGFAGLASPAQAGGHWPPPDHDNISTQSGNTAVCGNETIGDITLGLITLAPVTATGNEPVNCNFTVNQH